MEARLPSATILSSLGRITVVLGRVMQIGSAPPMRCLDAARPLGATCADSPSPVLGTRPR